MKYFVAHRIQPGHLSRPPRGGAWIEIANRSGAVGQKEVAPLAGGVD